MFPIPMFRRQNTATLGEWYSGDSWYLTAGVTAANVLAAFRAKNAPSLADSYTNIANPGTNNCTAPVSAPTWAAATGWTFASGQELIVGSGALKSGAPLSMLALLYMDDATGYRDVMDINNSAGNNLLTLMPAGDMGGDPVLALAQATTNALAQTSTGYSAAVWFVGAAVFTSSTSRAAYINGGSKGTDTTDKTPSGLNETTIGNFGAGKIAACAFYSVALNDTQVAAISTAMLAL